MCGQALISPSLVRKGLAEVTCGAKSARDASMMMAKPCICGIYNLDRSVEMLTQQGQSGAD